MTDQTGSKYNDHCKAVALGSVKGNWDNIFVTCEHYRLIRIWEEEESCVVKKD